MVGRWNLVWGHSLSFRCKTVSFNVSVLPRSPLGIFDPFILRTSNLWYDGVIQAEVIFTTKPVTNKVLRIQSRQQIGCNKINWLPVIFKQYLLLYGTPPTLTPLRTWKRLKKKLYKYPKRNQWIPSPQFLLHPGKLTWNLKITPI